MRFALFIRMSRVIGWTLLLLALISCAAIAPEDPDDQTLEKLLTHSFGTSGAAFSPDNRYVAVGTRDIIRVADTWSNDTVTSLTSSRAAKYGNSKGLHFIDDQRLVIGVQGGILLWNVANNRIIDQLSLPNRDYSPRAIAWSATDQMLAFSIRSGAAPVKIVPIDQRGFGPIREFKGFEGVPRDLQYSRNGRYLAATGDGEGVFIREVASGELVGELPTRGYVSELELYGENQLLVAGADIAFWTFLDKERVDRLDNPGLRDQIAGQVAARVAGVIALGTLTLFSAMLETFAGEVGPSGELAAATVHVATHPVKTSRQPWCGRSTAISPDGKWLVDVYPGITREVIQVYDMESERRVKGLNPRGEYSCAVKFSPDGKQLLITTEKVVRLYDTETWGYRDLRLDD